MTLGHRRGGDGGALLARGEEAKLATKRMVRLLRPTPDYPLS